MTFPSLGNSMSEASNENKNQATILNKKIRKFAVSLVMICGLIFLGCFAFQFWKNESEKKQNAKAEIGKIDNIDSEIFDLSDDSDDGISSEIAINELKEKGAEFIYQTLLKHQMQIDELHKQIKNLQNDFAKYKSQERVAKTVFAYVDLRQAFLAGKSYDEEFKNFEMLSSFDSNLYAKTSKIKTILPKFHGEEKLVLSFQKLIPDIILNKNKTESSGIVEKIYSNISRLVIIRRTKETGGNDVDSVIVRTEKLLQEKKYREASTNLLLINESHQKILQNFLNDLDAAAQLQEVDSDIVNHLKSLR